tara:strand:+ start:9637 stop:10368 length:732 start_codon:yes stop_codon:yes gene_type:complete
MRIPRIFHAGELHEHQTLELDPEPTHHILRVLRMQPDDALILFNGQGHHFSSRIVEVSKKSVRVFVESQHLAANESPLHLHLGQVISRGDRMDFTLQKSVELGVQCITPLFSTRCGVKLSGERLAKKIQQWQKIVISACEQSGRDIVPEVRPAMTLEQWCQESDDAYKITLHPRANIGINELTLPQPKVRLLIGSEGGLTDEEIQTTTTAGFTEVLLGPRVLRTETAALTAITALQFRFGDLG